MLTAAGGPGHHGNKTTANGVRRILWVYLILTRLDSSGGPCAGLCWAQQTDEAPRGRELVGVSLNRLNVPRRRVWSPLLYPLKPEALATKGLVGPCSAAVCPAAARTPVAAPHPCVTPLGYPLGHPPHFALSCRVRPVLRPALAALLFGGGGLRVLVCDQGGPSPSWASPATSFQKHRRAWTDAQTQRCWLQTHTHERSPCHPRVMGFVFPLVSGPELQREWALGGRAQVS